MGIVIVIFSTFRAPAHYVPKSTEYVCWKIVLWGRWLEHAGFLIVSTKTSSAWPLICPAWCAHIARSGILHAT